MKQKEMLCDEMDTVRQFTYLGDRVSAGVGCEAVVSARTRCGWVRFRECSELLYGRKFPLRLEGTVYESYVRPAIMCGNAAWCLKESEMGILQRRQRCMVRAMCGVQLIDRKRSTDLMFMLGLIETMDYLATANIVHWYGHVLSREDGHVLRRALDFEFVIIIMVIFKCYFSGEHIALSYKNGRNQQIKDTAHDRKSYMK